VCDVCEFQNVHEAELLRFCFKEVTFDPYLLITSLCYMFDV
jgi:hypothetical protein